jgi:hypothetical protein
MRRDATASEVMEELRRRARDQSALEVLLPACEEFLRLEEETPVPPLPPGYEDASEARALLARGVSLLQREGILIFPQEMGPVWQHVCDVAMQNLDEVSERLQELRAWPETQPERWLATMGQYFRDGEVRVEDPEEKGLFTFLLIHTWRPFLRRWAAALASLTQDAHWREGRCPVCGGQPDFAYLAVETGERHLICARCDTEWRHQRLGCPFCGNKDAATYGYHPDELEMYRLYVCKNCGRYLKTLDLRHVPAERLLAVERVASVAMDVAAMQEGYQSA